MKLKEIEKGMVVHCNTEEEAKELIKWAYECGFEWLMSNNSSTHWDANQAHGIYYYFGKFGDGIITYEKEINNKSIEFSDIVIPDSEPKFKVGDVVITKEHGESWLVIDVDNSEKTVFYRCVPRFINTYRTYLFKEDEIELSLESEEEPEEELTAEEAIRLTGKICDTHGCNNCCLNNESYLSCDEWKMEHPEEVVEVLKQYKHKKDHTTTLSLHEIEWVYSVINCYTNKEEIICQTEQGAQVYCEKLAKEIGTKCKYERVCRVKES